MNWQNLLQQIVGALDKRKQGQSPVAGGNMMDNPATDFKYRGGTDDRFMGDPRTPPPPSVSTPAPNIPNEVKGGGTQMSGGNLAILQRIMASLNGGRGGSMERAQPVSDNPQVQTPQRQQFAVGRNMMDGSPAAGGPMAGGRAWSQSDPRGDIKQRVFQGLMRRAIDKG